MTTYLWRRACWKLFGWPSVVLIDGDGTQTVSFIFKTATGEAGARRLDFNIRNVILNADGSVSGGVYVKSWRAAWWNPRPTLSTAKATATAA